MSWLRRIVRALRPWKARARAAHLKRGHQPVERIFAEIYRDNEWGGGKGAYYSGAGSHDSAIIEPYVKAVRALLSSLPGKPAVIDLGSGDFNVGRHFVDFVRHYYACDIVPDLQEYNRQHFVFSNVEFLCVNAVENELPAGDVVCIRQVLQHLSNAQIQQVIDRCQKYGRWIVSEHLADASGFIPNVDISAGCGTRVLFKSGVVLTAPPFNVTGYSTRTLCEVYGYGGVIRTTLFERQPESQMAQQ